MRNAIRFIPLLVILLGVSYGWSYLDYCADYHSERECYQALYRYQWDNGHRGEFCAEDNWWLIGKTSWEISTPQN